MAHVHLVLTLSAASTVRVQQGQDCGSIGGGSSKRDKCHVGLGQCGHRQLTQAMVFGAVPTARPTITGAPLFFLMLLSSAS